MKITTTMTMGALVVGAAGCASDPNTIGATNPHQPGPAAGRAVGAGAGAAAGNLAGAVVGVGEGFSHGASASFNNSSRVVRRWRTETTADGRVIQVPEDIEVDQYGRPLNSKPPTTPPAGKN